MLLYCISLFLSPSVLRGIHDSLIFTRLGSLTELEVEDQTGDTASGHHFRLEGLSLLLLPANSFHVHRDFEIGLTEATREEWEVALKGLVASGLVTQQGPMPKDLDTEFAVLGGSEIHGPFFGIFDGNHADIPDGLELTVRLPPAERAFYERLQPHLAPRFAESFQVHTFDSLLPVFEGLKVPLNVPRPACVLEQEGFCLTVSATAFELSLSGSLSAVSAPPR